MVQEELMNWVQCCSKRQSSILVQAAQRHFQEHCQVSCVAQSHDLTSNIGKCANIFFKICLFVIVSAQKAGQVSGVRWREAILEKWCFDRDSTQDGQLRSALHWNLWHFTFGKFITPCTLRNKKKKNDRIKERFDLNIDTYLGCFIGLQTLLHLVKWAVWNWHINTIIYITAANCLSNCGSGSDQWMWFLIVLAT